MVLGESNKKEKIVYERIGFNNDLPILIIYPDKMRDVLEKNQKKYLLIIIGIAAWKSYILKNLTAI